MNNFKHLTNAELAAYSLGTLEIPQLHGIGRHLLNCAKCRRRLPMPSEARVWGAIMTDTEVIVAPVKKEAKFSRGSIFSDISAFLKLQSGLLWGGAVLLIIFSFSFLIWLNAKDSGSEVSRTLDNETGSEFNFPLPIETPMKENPIFSTNSNRAFENPTPKISKTEVPKQKVIQPASSQNSNNFNLNRQKEKVVATRGVSDKCSENNSIELEYLMSRENLVFKWKAIPKAAKYHLYISDDEEILIDEFETVTETTFVLKKPLNPLKTYKWKIIVTLENGQTVVGISQKFTMKDFQTNQKKIKPNRNSETRCIENR